MAPHSTDDDDSQRFPADLCKVESRGVGYSRPCLSPSGPVKGEPHRPHMLQLRCNLKDKLLAYGLSNNYTLLKWMVIFIVTTIDWLWIGY